MFPEPGRDYHLSDAEIAAANHPSRVRIPDREVRLSLRQGAFAKLILDIEDGPSERFWVKVTQVVESDGEPLFRGVVDSDLGFPWIWELDCGDKIEFRARNVFEMMWPLDQELPVAAG